MAIYKNSGESPMRVTLDIIYLIYKNLTESFYSEFANPKLICLHICVFVAVFAK
jgi:hypothetical protein